MTYPIDITFAQIIPDQTLPQPSVIETGCNSNCQITGGTLIRDNLFHSFKEFSIPTGGVAYFNNNATIQNIFTRVTGKSISHIDGQIRANGSANLYFLNPHGIVFGANASLKIGGSFIASTRDSWQFTDGSEYSATNPKSPPLLQVNVPMGVQWGADSLGEISNAGNLTVSPGQRLTLLGNTVTNTGSLVAPGGTIEIIGTNINLLKNSRIDVASMEKNQELSSRNPHINLQASNDITIKDLTDNQLNFITNGGQIDFTADADGNGIGGVVMTNLGDTINTHGSDIAISGASLQLGNIYAGVEGQNRHGGAIALHATNGDIITTSLDTSAFSLFGEPGNGGNISVLSTGKIETLFVDTSSYSASGYAGVIALHAEGDINISKYGIFAYGNSPNINQAINNNINIISNTGLITLDNAYISNIYTGLTKGSDINLTATSGSILIKNGGRIQTTTISKGDVGAVNVYAKKQIAIDGVGENILTNELFTSQKINSKKLDFLEQANSNIVYSDISRNRTTRHEKKLVNTNFLPSGIFSNIAALAEGNARDMHITAESLSLSQGGQILASTFAKGNTANIHIHTDNHISLDGTAKNNLSSGVFTTVQAGAKGNGGDINITTTSLSVTNGAQVNATTFGKGLAGDVLIHAKNQITLDGVGMSGKPSAVFSIVETDGRGDGGTVNIQTGSLSASNGAQIAAATRGKGDAGKVIIHAQEHISFDGIGNNQFSTGVFSSVEENGEGQGGDIEINSRTLSVSNGAFLTASTLGKGDAGKVIIHAQEHISFDGVGTNGFGSGAYSNIEPGGNGKAGGVNITTQSLSATNGAQIAAATRGKGDAGKVIIHAQGDVSFDGLGTNGVASGAFSSVEPGAEGQGGDINIVARSLFMNNGSQLNASTSGKGDAGSITVKTKNLFSAEDSRIFSVVQPGAEGRGGGIKITTGDLSVSRGAQIAAATRGQGDAGTIVIRADNRAAFDGIDDKGLFSGVFSTVESAGEGLGGSIDITAGSLSFSNTATVSVSAVRNQAGNIKITADKLFLNKSKLLAVTGANETTESGEISLFVKDLLLMRNNSGISAQAFNSAKGGNINIDANSGFVVALPLENSDIIANASKGNGGNINITTQGIFGLAARPQNTYKSDITASSEFGLNGEITINTLNIDPAKGLINLPVNFLDNKNQVSPSCGTNSGNQQNRFIVTGRGGVPSNPNELFTGANSLVDLVDLVDLLPAQKNHQTVNMTSASSPTIPMIQAQGWAVDAQGRVYLVAHTPSANPTVPQPQSACSSFLENQ
ncbi:hemagglutination activity domain protein [Richelia sinica FACHB-800]|uniref:Hemagglutination activity domain protein n=1 Tax=Richelia sinica FACHB-800 TaxID=1357546 RepID=A0A975T5U2_9NOST|nr:hemagglutination activity domain protein [Richelia sinica FACHB-800]